MNESLYSELMEVLGRKGATRKALEAAEEAAREAKAATVDARKAYRAACDAVEEVEREIATGSTGRPLLDAARPAPVEPPRRTPAPPITRADEEPVRIVKGSSRARAARAEAVAP